MEAMNQEPSHCHQKDSMTPNEKDNSSIPHTKRKIIITLEPVNQVKSTLTSLS